MIALNEDYSFLDYNIFINENLEFVNEAYVGKTPTLEKIEKKIGEIRPKIKYSGANSTLKEVLELNRLFEEQFGMDTYALQIYPAADPNAYTMVLATNFDIAMYEDLPSMIEADNKNGYRFKPDNGFCIMSAIATSLMMDDNYTDEEIVAVLLHELGHNFADCIYDDINIANRNMMNNYRKALIATAIFYAFTVIGIPVALKLLNELRVFNNSYKRKQEKKNQKVGKGKIKAFLGSIKAKYDDFNSLINGIFNRIFAKGTIKRYKRMADIMGAKEKAKKSLGRQNEIIADKFAGIYGYGPAQATALLKLSNTPSNAAKAVSKFGEWGQKINDEFDELMRDLTDYDVHPHVIQRIMEEIKLLENELKKEDIDSKVKEIIEIQLQQLRDIVTDACTVSDVMSKSEKAQALYNQYIANECPDAVEKEIEDKIEEALDKALNGGK